MKDSLSLSLSQLMSPFPPIAFCVSLISVLMSLCLSFLPLRPSPFHFRYYPSRSQYFFCRHASKMINNNTLPQTTDKRQQSTNKTKALICKKDKDASGRRRRTERCRHMSSPSSLPLSSTFTPILPCHGADPALPRKTSKMERRFVILGLWSCY